MSDKIKLIKERDRLFIKSQHLAMDNADLRKENEALKAELAAIKKNIKDKYRNANEALGLNLGETQ